MRSSAAFKIASAAFMLICFLTRLVCGIDISPTRLITTGKAKISSSTGLHLTFRDSFGWLCLRPGGASLLVSMASGNQSSLSEWYHLTRWDGVFLTGSSKYAEVDVFASHSTTVEYAAGHVGTEYTGFRCNELHVSTSHEVYGNKHLFTGKTIRCYVDALLRRDTKLSGPLTTNFKAWVYNEQAQQYQNRDLTGQAVAIEHTSSESVFSSLNVVSQSPTSDHTMTTLPVMNMAGPAMFYGGGVYGMLSGDRCTSYDSCGDDSPLPLEVIIPAIVAALVIIGGIVILIRCCKKFFCRQVGSQSSSSSSSSKCVPYVPPPPPPMYPDSPYYYQPPPPPPPVSSAPYDPYASPYMPPQ